MNNSELYYRYGFKFPDGRQKTFDIYIDQKTLTASRTGERQWPEWTRMENFKCSHCPLPPDENQYCPVAISLVDVIEAFNGCVSYDKVEVTITTDARQYMKNDSLQAGVSSLLGILMVTSGCPVMGKLKPMVRFHLPFASLDETEYRVISMYLLAQYFIKKRGGRPDWDLENLPHIYEDIIKLNQNVCRRIADLEQMDTSINSVVVLNNFADYVSVNITEKMLDEIEFIFNDYVNTNEVQ